MRKLYSAKVARPISSHNTRPTRLGFGTTAWCPYEDLIAVVSGCGAVAVFHADSPGEVSLLVGSKKSPARHVVWRNSPAKPLMLVVADAAGRITFWVSHDRRVNVWGVAADVEVPSVVIAIGWNKASTAMAAVLAHGALALFQVPDLPSTNDRRLREKFRDPSAARQPDTKYPNTIRPLISKNPKLTELFGGQLRCATVAPGEVEPTSVALVTVNVARPTRLSVWNLSISKTSHTFDVRPIAETDMPPEDSGTCVACAAVPRSGMLFAIGDRGVIARWHLRYSRNSVESGWQLQAQARVEKELVHAVDHGVVPKSSLPIPTDANSRSLEASRMRKIYAFEISTDCKSLITSTSSGLLFWNAEKLKIDAGHRVDHPLRPDSALDTPSPYWGLCVSPTGAAVFALNGRGYVEAFSLITPIVGSNQEDSPAAVSSVVRRLLSIPCAGWDFLSSIAFEGPTAASLVAKALVNTNLRTNPNVSADRIARVKSLMLRIIYAEDASATMAKQLLDLATDAIKKSAPDNVKLKLMVSAKDAKSLTSPANVGKAVRQLLSSTRVAPTQLAAAPLADWIMVLCAVWLQRCAEILAKHDPKGQRMGKPWLSVVSMTVRNEKNFGPGHGIVYDTVLVRALRPASFAALLLLALEEEFGEPETTPRYFRFSRDDASCVVAALWEVSLAWESVDTLSRSVKNGPGGPSPMQAGQTAEQMVTTAVVLGKHLAAGRALENAEELRICPAEKALGLHGASKGAGFVMSCVRMHQGENGPVGLGDDASKSAVNLRAEWCQHDIVTGRPLPPWAPLRRCVVSGLLAAEITKQKSGPPNVNMASPWITRWANESPFGGQWARVPSLDLDRFELLPAVNQAGVERMDSSLHSGVSMVDRHRKGEDVPSTTAARNPVNGPPQGVAQMQPTGMSFPPDSHLATGVVGPGGMDDAALAAALPSNGGPPHPLLNNGVQMPYPTAASGSPMLTHGLPGGRIQAPPVMSTAMSTDAGSTLSKGSRKRGATGGSRSRSKKRPTVEQRTPAGPMNDLSGGMGLPGAPGVPPGNMNAMGRPGVPADVLSTEARSAVTAGTNGTGGVDQEVSKPRKRAKGKSRQSHRGAAAGAVQPTNMNAALVQGVAPPLSQAMHMAARNAHSKKQIMTKQHDPTAAAVATAAAAAEAAAAAAATPVVAGNRSARNTAMLAGGMHGAGLQGVGGGDMVVQMPFVGGGTGGMPAGMGTGPMTSASLPGAQRRVVGSFGLPADLNMMGNGMGNVPVNAANVLQQGGFGPMGNGMNMGGIGGQGGVNINVLHQLGNGGNTNAGMGDLNGQQPWATIARNLGQMGNLPSENAVLEALQRKAELQAAASMGGGGVVTSAGIGNDGGMMGNGGIMGSAGMGRLDMVGNAMGASMVGGLVGGVGTGMGSAGMGSPDGVVSAGMVSAGMGHLNGDGNTTGNMVGAPGNGNDMVGMGAGMVNMRTSRAESAGSVPGRGSVGTGGLENVGATGMGVGSTLGIGVNGDGGSTLSIGVNGDGGMVNGSGGGINNNNMQNNGNGPGVHGAPTTTPAGPGRGLGNRGTGGASDERGERIWEGHLQARGDEERDDLMLSCVAMRCDLQEKAVIRDASGWPPILQCDKTHIKSHPAVMDSVGSPSAQGYVRFAGVEEDGNEREFSKFVMFLVERRCAFEIRCNEGKGTPGTLYLWGMLLPTHGPSLLGAFKPDAPAPQPPLPNDAELQYMMLNAGGTAGGPGLPGAPGAPGLEK